jgi:hypothetical protein
LEEIKPNDFTFPEDKSHMVFKDKTLEIALDRFLEKLEPLENRILPIISSTFIPTTASCEVLRFNKKKTF